MSDSDDKKPVPSLEAVAALQAAGVIAHVNPETGAVALFPEIAGGEIESNYNPEKRPEVTAWFARSKACHEAQQPIKLDPKPESDPMDNLEFAEAQRAKRRAERQGTIAGKVRGAWVSDIENPENDKLPSNHRQGSGTIGLNVVKV